MNIAMNTATKIAMKNTLSIYANCRF